MEMLFTAMLLSQRCHTALRCRLLLMIHMAPIIVSCIRWKFIFKGLLQTRTTCHCCAAACNTCCCWYYTYIKDILCIYHDEGYLSWTVLWGYKKSLGTGIWMDISIYFIIIFTLPLKLWFLFYRIFFFFLYSQVSLVNKISIASITRWLPRT